MSNGARIAVVLAALFLAAILVAYVFIGGSDNQVAGPTNREVALRCTAPRTSDEMKRELFRRAADLRGSNDPAFDKMSAIAALRIEQAQLSNYDAATDGAHCRALVIVDPGPGKAANSGPRNIAASLDYTIRPSADGSGDVVSIDNAERMLAQLASLAPTGSGTAEALRPAVTQNAGQVSAINSREAAVQPRPVLKPAAPPRERASPEAAPTPTSAAEKSGQLTRRPAAADRHSFRNEIPRTRYPIQPPREQARAGPSFDCRRASKQAHFAVCEDPYLARLDRQMAREFNRAFSTGTPAVRELLQRTRPRFLAYRNACRSNTCIANTYRSRMLEISDIAGGRWRVP